MYVNIDTAKSSYMRNNILLDCAGAFLRSRFVGGNKFFIKRSFPNNNCDIFGKD